MKTNYNTNIIGQDIRKFEKIKYFFKIVKRILLQRLHFILT